MSDRSVIKLAVVDDTLANRWVLMRVLQEAGYVVAEGETAADAVRLANERPDLLVLDVRLPDGNGFEIARRLKADPSTADIPLLLISASFTSPNERAQGLDAGADGYLTHPVEPPVLLATIRALLRSREAERALRESEARFRSMADSAPVMIWLGDAHGGAEWFSRSWLEFTGLTLAEQLAQGWAPVMHPEDVGGAVSIYSAHLSTREAFRMELRLRRHDGAYRWVLNSASPRFNGAGEFVGYIGSVLDISDRKDGEIERERLLSRERNARAEADAARMAAEHANDVKAQFLAAMSHELRTPLNAIGGYVDLLQLGIRGPVTDAQREDLERIRKNQRHLLGLINNVLNLTRLETGRVEYRVRPVLVSSVLADLASLVQPQFAARDITLVSRLLDGGSGSDLHVAVDREKLIQILTNLLGNAAKFTPGGGEVELRLEPGDAGMVQVQVRDTGPGIPADKLEVIFEPFVQLERSLTTPSEGAGLGLAISRDLARGMGGDLWAESETGSGATLILTVPRAAMPDPGARG